MTHSIPLRILYVEDNSDIRDYMHLLLSAAGYEVVLAANLVEGLRQSKSRSFDLFLLDNGLPDGTGIELCRMIRTFDTNTPVLLYSADTDPKSKDAAFLAGAQEFIGKQENIENIIQTISVFTKTKLQSRNAELGAVPDAEVSQSKFDRLIERYNSDFRFLLMRVSYGQYDCLLTSFLVLRDFYGAIMNLHEISKLEFRVIPYPISLRPSGVMLRQLGFNEDDIEMINGFLQSIRETQGREFEDLLDEGLPILCGPKRHSVTY